MPTIYMGTCLLGKMASTVSHARAHSSLAMYVYTSAARLQMSAARVALINTSHVRVSGTLFPGGAAAKKGPPYKAISLTNLKLKYI
jgi:hypothetical protein